MPQSPATGQEVLPFSADEPMLLSAVETVAAAARIARGVQRDPDSIRRITKDDRSPVTVADFAVQAVVHLGLSGAGDTSARQSLRIVGEESAGILRDVSQSAVLDAVVKAVRGYRPDVSRESVLAAIDACDHDASADSYWVLDPIDGTKGFLRGQQYAIALALVRRGQIVLGVMGCPNLPSSHESPLDIADERGVIYVASRSHGTWETECHEGNRERRFDRISVDGRAAGNVRACESVEATHSKQDDTQRILAELGEHGDPVRLDSQCKYAVVARGQADAYLRLPTMSDYVEKIWDHAAGALIATEAGAIVSDITGAPLDFSRGTRLETNRGIVCASRAFHGRIIDAISKLGIAGGPASTRTSGT